MDSYLIERIKESAQELRRIRSMSVDEYWNEVKEKHQAEDHKYRSSIYLGALSAYSDALLFWLDRAGLI